MSRSPGRRRLSGAVGVALALTLAGGAVPALADSAHASSADVGTDAAGDGVAITSGALSVSVAKDFPRVLSYTDRASGARLLGSTSPVTEVTLNGKAYKVGLKAAPKVTAHRAAYTLVFPDLPGVEIDAALDVAGRATTFKVTAVRDTETFRLGTLDIPGHDLISVGSTDTGAETAFTRLDTDSTRTADVFGKVTASTAPDVPGGRLVRDREHRLTRRGGRVQLDVRQARRSHQRRQRPLLAPGPQGRRRQCPRRRLVGAVDLPR